MPFPFVSRERYTEKCAELADIRAAHHDLFDKYSVLLERYDERGTELTAARAELAALRKQHDALLAEREKPRREPKPPKPQCDPMLDRMTADLAATMGDAGKARDEALRIKREAFGGPL